VENRWLRGGKIRQELGVATDEVAIMGVSRGGASLLSGTAGAENVGFVRCRAPRRWQRGRRGRTGRRST